jgi:hypothetical protein
MPLGWTIQIETFARRLLLKIMRGLQGQIIAEDSGRRLILAKIYIPSCSTIG